MPGPKCMSTEVWEPLNASNLHFTAFGPETGKRQPIRVVRTGGTSLAGGVHQSLVTRPLHGIPLH